MAKACAVCGGKASIVTGRVEMLDGFVCRSCLEKSLWISDPNCRTSKDFHARFKYLEDSKKLFDTFNPTTNIPDFFQIDVNNRLFKIGKSSECFLFDELINYELIEDGESVVRGGLGRAVVGGLAFGGVGAIVGGVTGGKKSKSIITNMYIRGSLINPWIKDFKINIIDTEIKKNGWIYKNLKEMTEKIISALEIIINQQKQPKPDNIQISITEEIRKFKQLLDEDIITQEDYEIKKNQLLNL